MDIRPVGLIKGLQLGPTARIRNCSIRQVGTGQAIGVGANVDSEILIGHDGGVFSAVADVPTTDAEIRFLCIEEVRISH